MQTFNLEYVTTKDGTLTFNCMECDKSYKKKLNKDLIKDSKTHRASATDN